MPDPRLSTSHRRKQVSKKFSIFARYSGTLVLVALSSVLQTPLVLLANQTRAASAPRLDISFLVHLRAAQFVFSAYLIPQFRVPELNTSFCNRISHSDDFNI